MTSLAAPKVALKLTPVPKSVLYAGITGEMLKNTGMKDDDQIRAIQQAVSEGLIAKVIVAAKHSDGRVEKFTLTIKPFSITDSVELSMEAGKSYLECVDTSLAAAVQYASDLIKRQGLTPNFYVDWSARAKATPAIVAEAIKRLNVREEPIPPPSTNYLPDDLYVPPVLPSSLPKLPPKRYPQTVRTYTTPPPLPPNYTYKPVLTIKPAKDPGVEFTYDTSRKTGKG
jgi:hypothetical protein